ncbi:hypothetical protein ROTAS13_03137 [Roseomonas sp. TAS13]|uniref:hypothetical protein n=1 Tax=Roseomonas sp. TAS13 TaxID=1926319 RepID=UPI0009620F8A|nr:hypothetical protein [Roseomonas sp. TAS13]GAV35461.1 hypothetical protein ROTAS13_03137 [Roseomonas sp. TAS13]
MMSGSGAVWQPHEITFEWIPDLTAHPFVTIIAHTPIGDLYLMGDYEEDGHKVTMRGCHINGGPGVHSKSVGQANLRAVAQKALYMLGRYELEIHGSTRTSGARPGHVPKPFRFRR